LKGEEAISKAFEGCPQALSDQQGGDSLLIFTFQGQQGKNHFRTEVSSQEVANSNV
jgi:hypothetical protein